MTSHLQPLRRPALTGLGLLLTLSLASGARAHVSGVPQRSRPLPQSGSVMIIQRPAKPYLAALGAIPLRFAPASARISDAPPAPPMRAEPPPVVVALPPERPKPVAEPPAPATPPPQADPPPETDKGAKPLGIIPDDTHREIRPEDVLPFFQYPGGSSDNPSVNVVVPFTPAQPRESALPPSSATYQLK